VAIIQRQSSDVMRDYGKKTVVGRQLVWWKAQADERYWYTCFAHQIDSSHLVAGNDNSRLINLLKSYLPKEGRILEAGCGTGWLVSALQQRGYDIEGVDYSEPLVHEVLEKYPSLSIRVGDVCSLSVTDNYYSGYISLGVIEHRQAGCDPFLREAYRIVAPLGILCISVPFFNPLRRLKSKLGLFQGRTDGLGFYQYGFTRDHFKTILERHGFRVLNFEFYGSLRCIEEDLPWLDRILRTHGIWRWRKRVDLLDPLGIVPHMIMAVAEKPE